MDEKERKQDNQKQSFDVVIVGGGAAGLSAAMWCDELGLDAVLLEAKERLGGQLLRVYNPIKNYLGVEAENGQILSEIFIKQLEKRKFTLRLQSEVSKVELKTKTVSLKNGNNFAGKTLVIATGVRRRKLNVPGEETFKNHGIIESGQRNKDSVAGKTVCIIGGGDAALENALILSETASQVYLIHRRDAFRARPEFFEKVTDNKKVKVFTETVVTKILGEEKIEAVELQNLKTREQLILPVEALLLRIGVEPNTRFFQDLSLNESGYIEINANCETSIENVFAAGDVANRLAPTISSAVGMGATVAKVIFDRLNS